MRILLTLATCIAIATSCSAQQFNWFNSLQQDFVNTPSDEVILSVTLDDLGNKYVMGYSTSLDVDLDPGPSSFYLTASGILPKYFVMKYSPNGDFIWAKNLPDIAVKISFSPLGDLIVTGYIRGDFNYGNFTFHHFGPSGSGEIYLGAHDAQTGDVIWARSFKGFGYDVVEDMCTDSIGNIYLTGRFSSNWDSNSSPAGILGANPNANWNISNGGNDIVLVKLNSVGETIWANCIGGAFNDKGMGVEIDHNSNVLITGLFSDSVDFNLDPSSTNQLVASSASSFSHPSDAFLAKYDANGNYIFSTTIVTSTNANQGITIDVDENNNIYTSGKVSNPWNSPARFFPSTLNILDSTNSGVNLYFCKLDPVGYPLWHFVLGYNGSVNGIGDFVYYNDNVYVGARFQCSNSAPVDMDPSANDFFIISPSANNHEAAFAKYDSQNGSLVWAHSVGGTAKEEIGELHVSNFGIVMVGGARHGDVDFDFSANTAGLQSLSDFDGFIVHYTEETDLSIADQNQTLTNLSAYPQPFSDKCYIQFENPEDLYFSLDIYDINGKLVKQTSNIKGTFVQIDKAHLTAGLYLFHLYSAHKNYSGKLTVN